MAADPVVDVVADDRGRRQEPEKKPRIQRSECREAPGGKEQRIARQERQHHQSGLAEDDQEEDAVGPRAVVVNDPAQVPVEMQDEVDEGVERVIRSSLSKPKFAEERNEADIVNRQPRHGPRHWRGG